MIQYDRRDEWRGQPETVATATSDRNGLNSLAFVGRQAIYNSALTVIAYELLYRALPEAADAQITDSRQATLHVLANAVLEIGLDRLAGGVPVHINYPRELLASDEPPSLQPDRVVIEILEDVRADPRVLAGLRSLRERGHRIALYDFSPECSDPALLELADIVKVDLARESASDVERTVQEAKRRGLKLIAENVRSVEDFERAVELGFDAFQGEFLQSTQVFKAQRLPASRLATLRLMVALQNEDYSVEEIERLVAQDVSFSYRVLRCINSSYYNLPRRIESIRQAIVILGLENLRQMCTVVALLSFDERPASLLLNAMIRARMCEQLAQLAGVQDSGPYFITGLFSMLDTLLGMPVEEIVADLPLATPVVRALIDEEGDLGLALRCTRAYERGAWNQVAYRKLPPDVIRAAYLDSVFWAEETRALLTA